MDTALYYTFSTISQTFAGAIALLGAFALYRLQQISSEIVELGDSSFSFYINNSKNKIDLENKRLKGQYREVLDYIKSNPLDDLPEAIERYLGKLDKLLIYKEKILTLFKVSLILTLGLILYSIVMLPFVPQIVKHLCPSAATISVTIAFILVICCLISYFLLIRKIVFTSIK
jgi:hypothetical protein